MKNKKIRKNKISRCSGSCSGDQRQPKTVWSLEEEEFYLEISSKKESHFWTVSNVTHNMYFTCGYPSVA